MSARAGAVDRASPSTGLDWLASADGTLRGLDGQPIRLVGLRSGGDEPQRDLRDARTLLCNVAAGQRCIAVPIERVAQTRPAELTALDERIALHAEAGCYTILRIEARLWLDGHHLQLSRRYLTRSAVMFALIGRQPLARKLWMAAKAIRAVHPRAVVWLPLESAGVALSPGNADEGIGLLWDAARPQRPRPDVLQLTLRRPLLLDGWQPGTERNPLANDRLMHLCREGGIGWIAHSPTGWLDAPRGIAVPSRAARVLQRAVHQSSFDGAVSAAAGSTPHTHPTSNIQRRTPWP